jgi:hypothetical protein
VIEKEDLKAGVIEKMVLRYPACWNYPYAGAGNYLKIRMKINLRFLN